MQIRAGSVSHLLAQLSGLALACTRGDASSEEGGVATNPVAVKGANVGTPAPGTSLPNSSAVPANSLASSGAGSLALQPVLGFATRQARYGDDFEQSNAGTEPEVPSQVDINSGVVVGSGERSKDQKLAPRGTIGETGNVVDRG